MNNKEIIEKLKETRLKDKEIVDKNYIHKQKIKELLDNNLEKENNKYIVDSNACQCLVRKLIKILEGE